MLTVVDEYSRFPFAFPCRSTDAETVIFCLNQLFTLFGMPAYIHSERARPSCHMTSFRTCTIEASAAATLLCIILEAMVNVSDTPGSSGHL